MQKKKISLPVLYFYVGLVIVLFSSVDLYYVNFTGQPAYFGLFPYFQSAAIAVMTAFSLVLLAILLPLFVPPTEEDIFKTCLKAGLLLVIFFAAEFATCICFSDGTFLAALEIIFSLALDLMAAFLIVVALFVFGYLKEHRDKNKE